MKNGSIVSPSIVDPEQERSAPVAPINKLKILKALGENGDLSRNKTVLYSKVSRSSGLGIIDYLLNCGLLQQSQKNNLKTTPRILKLTDKGRKAFNLWTRLEAIL